MTDGYAVYKPGDPYHEQMIKNLEGIKPGESKPFPSKE